MSYQKGKWRWETECLDANVLSDAINAASRIENLNKFYKTRLLLSEEVYKQLIQPDEYLIRMVDKVFVKGKTQGMGLYEVVPFSAAKEIQNEQRYNEAFAAYSQGDFEKAETTFKLCLKQKPNDYVAEILRDRIIEFRNNGVPEGWDGTFKFLEK